MVQVEFVILAVGGIGFIYQIVKHKTGLGARLQNSHDLTHLDHNQKNFLFSWIGRIISGFDDAPDDRYLSKVLEEEMSLDKFKDYSLFKSKIDEIVQNYKRAEELNINSDARLTAGLENILYCSSSILGESKEESLSDYFSGPFFEGYHKTESLVRPVFTRAIQYQKTEYLNGKTENLRVLIDKVLYFSRMLIDEKNRDDYLHKLKAESVSLAYP